MIKQILDIAQGLIKGIDSFKASWSWAMSRFRKLRREHREKKSTKIIVNGDDRGMCNILRYLRKKRERRQDQS